MSQRLKRQQSRVDDASVPSKRRKGRSSPRVEEDEAASTTTAPLPADNYGEEMDGGSGSMWTPRPVSDLKISNIYNRNAPEAPAELFRKDLISAMKLPDSEPLAADEYWLISDQWKQEWERGVQVPVNPDSLPEPSVTVISQSERSRLAEFRLPKGKYVRTHSEGFSPEMHYLSNVINDSERACSYDLDDCDLAWLTCLNGERALMGLNAVREEQLERTLEEMEVKCWKNIQNIVRSEESLGIEFDENVICDVCRSPDSEEGNEMVFCDCCNICVHQACYGITTIPAGSWLCRTCVLTLRPECELCPNRGGAMKATRSGQKWAHVSCALWIPEVSIGCVERMEPITKISSIPQSRWALVCVLCRERVGACIQCSVKTCKTAYHVTCAFKHGLEMRAIIEDESADDGVKLRSYCQKHSVTSKKEKTQVGSGSDDEEVRSRRKRKERTSEERSQAKAAKTQEIEAEFDKHLTLKDLPAQYMDLDYEAIVSIYNYWKIKRKAGGNRPLIAPSTDDTDMLGRAQIQADQEKMRMFVQLRQDLERVRNLCYMVSRREKLSRSFFKIREQTFHKQVNIITTMGTTLTEDDHAAIVEANHGPSIYDRLYSHEPKEPFPDIDDLIARISGDKKSPVNGLLKRPPNSPLDTKNPYKRTYFNGASRYSMSSGSDSELDKSRIMSVRSDTSEDERAKKSTLKRMEREYDSSLSSSSDELTLPKSTVSTRLKANIYSDSEDEGVASRALLRTKAAVKEFTPASGAARGRKPKRKASSESKKDPTELIVPQRQAAKKATESMKSTTAPAKKPAEEKETKASPSDKKKTRSRDVYEFQKEDPDILAFVPQRQAAKKAAEHIKSGLRPGETAPAVPATAAVPEEARKAAKKPIKSTLSSSDSEVEDTQEKTRRLQRTVFGSKLKVPGERPFLDKGLEPGAESKQSPGKKLKTSERRLELPPNTTASGAGLLPPRQPPPPATPTPARDSKDRGEAAPRRDDSVSSAGSSSSGSSSSSSGSSSSGSSSSSSSSSSSDSSSSSESEADDNEKGAEGVPPAKQKSTLQKGVGPRKQNETTQAKKASPVKPSRRLTRDSSTESIKVESAKKKQPQQTTESKKESTPPVKRPENNKKVETAKKPTTTESSSPIKKPTAKQIAADSLKKVEMAKKAEPKKPIKVSPKKSPPKREANNKRKDAPMAREVSPKRETSPPPIKELVKKEVRKEPASRRDSIGSAAKKDNNKKDGRKEPVRTPRRESVSKERESTSPAPEVPATRKEPTPRRDSTPKREATPKRQATPKRETPKRGEGTPKRGEVTPKRGEVTPKRVVENETPKRRESTSKPMPKCKKKDLGLISEEETLLLSPQPPTPVQRSIFSPPHQKELSDFERQILAVDETMEDQPAQDEARNPPPFSFSFSNEILFKVDSKEDSARETLNLVEKLRLEYAKKSVDEPPTPKPEELPPSPPPAPSTPHPITYNALEVKVGPPERDKVDQSHGAQADERWVPPSPAPPAAAQSPLPPQAAAEVVPDEVTPQFVEARKNDPDFAGPREFAAAAEVPPSDYLGTHKPGDAEEYMGVRKPESEDYMGARKPESEEYNRKTEASDFMARKYAESEMLPSRRSSSSSRSSSTDREEAAAPPPPPVLPPTSLAEITGYGMALPPGADPAALFYGSHLFPPPGMENYPIFPPPYSIPHSFPPLLPPQIDETTCSGAAFTSSQHNMALTAALMSPGAQNAPFRPFQHSPEAGFLHAAAQLDSKPEEALNHRPELVPEQPATPLSQPATPLSQPATPLPDTPEITSSKKAAFVTPPLPAGKKSPTKPTRSSTRVIPKPPPTPKPVTPQSPKRKSARGGFGARGRGGKGRGKAGRAVLKNAQVPHKLQGTVYDFDDEDFDDAPPTPGVENLRAMRERRRSTDALHRGGEASHDDSFADAMSPPPPFPDVVQPLLPGPVDMRTYNYPSAPPALPEGILENQNQLLGSFANAEPHPVPEFAEDLEKQFHSELEASRPAASVATHESQRNQLKVKIKALWDANYTSTTPAAPATVPEAQATVSQAVATSGPSNLRRMRKKELLRQYWTQDMNMEAEALPTTVATTSAPVSRTVITIPKAVASMTSIPTREDYKAVVDADKKRRSESEQNTQKKRGRPKVAPTPKLKIRLGTSPESEERKLRIKPPKKRLSLHVPTVEELKRESMKFRKKIMADFDSKPSKKDKKYKNLCVLDTPVETLAPKIVIRLGKRPEEVSTASSESNAPTPAVNNNNNPVPPPPVPPVPPSAEGGETMLSVRTSKVTPIRLKLSRCEEGYVASKQDDTDKKDICKVR